MSRRKMAFLLFVAIAFAIAGAVMIAGNPRDYGGYFCAVFFVLAAPIFIWRLIAPPRLEVSPRGISWFNGRATLDYSWKDFVGFRAYRPSSRNLSKHVGFEFAPNYPGRGKMAAVAHALAGVDGSFGGQWEMSAQDLVDLLNQARAKWG